MPLTKHRNAELFWQMNENLMETKKCSCLWDLHNMDVLGMGGVAHIVSDSSCKEQAREQVTTLREHPPYLVVPNSCTPRAIRLGAH